MNIKTPTKKKGLEKAIEIVKYDISLKEDVLIIFIAGYAGTGKSTFASELSKSIPGSQVVTFDLFYYPLKQQGSELAARTYDFDIERFKTDLFDKFINGERGFEYQTYNWSWDDRDGLEWAGHKVGEGIKVLIIEGGICIHPSLQSLFSYSIWFNCEKEKRYERILKRESTKEGFAGNLNKIKALWEEQYDPLYDEYVRECNPEQVANIIIDTSEDGYRVIKKKL